MFNIPRIETLKFILVVVAVLCFQNSEAQAPEEAGSLTLKQAQQLAAEKNLTIEALKKRIGAAESGTVIAAERPNPSLLLETTRSQPNAFVGAGYLLELGDKRDHRIEISNKETLIAKMNVATALRELDHDVRVAFFGLIHSEEKKAQAGSSLDLSRQLLQISRERYQAGDVAQIEVLQAELESKRRDNDLKTAESDQEIARIRLNRLLNLSSDAGLKPEGRLEDIPSVENLQQLLDTAMAQHPELKTLNTEVEAEQSRGALERAARIPDLDLEGGTEIHDADFEYGWRAALKIELPLFNRRKGEITRSSALVLALQTDAEAARERILSLVNETYVRFEAAKFRAENFKNEIVPQAGQIEELSQESYHEGKTGILQALEAQRSARETRIEYLDSLLELQTAFADLENAVGVSLE